MNRYIRLRGLEISVEKCGLIQGEPKIADLPRHYINNSEIIPKDSIKVLGVPINKHLQLDYDDKETMQKIVQDKKLLRHLKISRLILSTLVQRQMFESSLRSLLIYNYIPMLAIDAKARIWAEKNFIFTITYILGIPRYVPHGLISIMTNMHNSDETIQEQLPRVGEISTAAMAADRHIWSWGRSFAWVVYWHT